MCTYMLHEKKGLYDDDSDNEQLVLSFNPLMHAWSFPNFFSFLPSCSCFVYAVSLLESRTLLIVHVDMQAHTMWGCRQEQNPLKA